MTDEERDEIIIGSDRPLTQKEKELEATVKFTPVGRRELLLSAEQSGRYGFAPSVVRSIGDKEEAEIYELLDYWYGLDNRKSKQSFVDNLLEYIEKERRAGYTLPCITPIKIKWINSWINPPIVRRALDNEELQKIFEDDKLRLKHYIEYCLTVDSMAKMAAAARTYEVYDDFINKTLYNALISIGMPNVGTYDGWKSATRRKK